MLIPREARAALNTFLQTLKLTPSNPESRRGDKAAKLEQILAYLELIHAQVRKYSKKRELIFIDCGAGNCYLSFLVYYFYTKIDERRVQIHCLDTNHRLMEKNAQLAQMHRFDQIFFHACDIVEYAHPGAAELVYSLHACDSATDKTLLLGLKTNARCILSVSCCQHSLRKRLGSHPYTGMTRHGVFKEKLVYMVADSLRALLLEMQGYQVDIVEFVSSRYTDKNILLRAQKGQVGDLKRLQGEYEKLQHSFRVIPALEEYLREAGNVPPFSALEPMHSIQEESCLQNLHPASLA